MMFGMIVQAKCSSFSICKAFVPSTPFNKNCGKNQNFLNITSKSRLPLKQNYTTHKNEFRNLSFNETSFDKGHVCEAAYGTSGVLH